MVNVQFDNFLFRKQINDFVFLKSRVDNFIIKNKVI